MANNSFSLLPRTGSVCSDECNAGEDTIPKEVRAARRSAAAALALSLAVFGVSVVLLYRTSSSQVAVGAPEAPAQAVVGLNSASQGQLSNIMGSFAGYSDSLKEAGSATTLHRPYILAADAPLTWEAMPGAATERILKKGTQVFPMNFRGAFIQVVVPRDQDGSNAAMGWLPVQEKGIRLLQPDTSVDSRRSLPRAPPPSKEELQTRWDEVRAMNNEFKNQLARFQTSVKDSYTEQMGSSPHHAKSGVAKAVNVEELRKVVSQIRSGVHKELKQSPEALLKDLGSALSK